MAEAVKRTVRVARLYGQRIPTMESKVKEERKDWPDKKGREIWDRGCMPVAEDWGRPAA